METLSLASHGSAVIASLPVQHSPLQVYITHIPGDFISNLGTLFAAFFGAAAAFLFNALQEHRREQRRRRNALNNAVYGLALTLNSLLNMKRQFLNDFREEFGTALKLIAEMNPAGDPNSVRQVATQVKQVFDKISAKDQTMNGAFKAWEEIEFLTPVAPAELAFTIEMAPDLLRLLTLVTSQTNQIARRIIVRNNYRNDRVDATLEEARNNSTPVHTLLFWYEMIAFRTIIGEHVDVALVAIQEALTQLENYRKQVFRKRNWFTRLIFGKDRWTTYKIPQAWQKLMPDRSLFRDVLEGVQNH